MLLSEIQNKRMQMIEVGLRNGYSHPETVRISQELDQLLNQLMFDEGLCTLSPDKVGPERQISKELANERTKHKRTKHKRTSIFFSRTKIIAIRRNRVVRLYSNGYLSTHRQYKESIIS